MIATAVVMAAGAIYEGMAASAAAESQANISKYNAQVQENNAKSIEMRTIVESQNQAEAGARQLGTLRAKAGGAGAVMTEGSPLLMLAEQEEQNIKENQMIGYRGVVGAQAARTQATLDRTQAKISTQKAKSAKTASYIKAGGSMMSGFSYGGSNPAMGQGGTIKIG